MRFNVVIIAATLTLLVSGCAIKPQLPVPLTDKEWSTKSSKVGVAMPAMPKVDTYFPGAGCLLCYGLASATNASLTKHTETLSHDDLKALRDDVASTLQKKNISVVVIKDPIDINSLPANKSTGTTSNVVQKDFSALGTKYNIDKLLIIDFSVVGFERTYSSYIPTSDPKAAVSGTAYLVDLKTNTYTWYEPVNIRRGASGNWDEAPKYPGLTNAYYQALEAARDVVLKPISTPIAQ